MLSVQEHLQRTTSSAREESLFAHEKAYARAQIGEEGVGEQGSGVDVHDEQFVAGGVEQRLLSFEGEGLAFDFEQGLFGDAVGDEEGRGGEDLFGHCAAQDGR